MRTSENAERTKNTKEKEKSCDMKSLARPLKIKVQNLKVNLVKLFIQTGRNYKQYNVYEKQSYAISALLFFN